MDIVIDESIQPFRSKKANKASYKPRKLDFSTMDNGKGEYIQAFVVRNEFTFLEFSLSVYNILTWIM